VLVGRAPWGSRIETRTRITLCKESQGAELIVPGATLHDVWQMPTIRTSLVNGTTQLRFNPVTCLKTLKKKAEVEVHVALRSVHVGFRVFSVRLLTFAIPASHRYS